MNATAQHPHWLPIQASRQELTMRTVRSMLRQSPAIATCAATLVFAAGTSIGVAATSARSAPAAQPSRAAMTALKWHRLPLGKGWHGSLRYAVSNGVVYLSGNAGDSGKPSGITTLPLR